LFNGPPSPGEYGTAPERSFAETFLSHNGAVADKWEHYLAIYDAELAQFIRRDEPVRLLEIGVQNGGSLEIWRNLLPKGSAIAGVDIDPRCAELALDDGIQIFVGDASDPARLDDMLRDSKFDVIIDDASHCSSQIIATFKSCFPRLAPGGIYVVEDLHCSYFSAFEGGFRKAGSAIEYFKTLVDALNSDHFEPDAQTSADAEELDNLRILSRELARVTFYDSVVVVRRLLETRDAPYRRIMGGRVAKAEPLLPGLGVGYLRNLLLTPESAEAFDPAIKASLVAARETVEAQRAAIDALQRSKESDRTAIELLKSKISSQIDEIDAVRRSERAALDDVKACRAKLSEAEDSLQQFLNSEVWRATKPLRWLLNTLRGRTAAQGGSSAPR